MSYYGQLLDAHMMVRGLVPELRRVPNHAQFSDARGWVTHRVVAFVGSKEVGHITVSHVPQALYDETLADPETFCRMIVGIAKPTREDMRRAPTRQREFRGFHVDAVLVDFVRVEENFRRRGFATRMYLEAARWMGEREGLVLAASGVQKPEIKRLWEKLVGDPDVPTTETADGRRALDYRPKDEP